VYLYALILLLSPSNPTVDSTAFGRWLAPQVGYIVNLIICDWQPDIDRAADLWNQAIATRAKMKIVPGRPCTQKTINSEAGYNIITLDTMTNPDFRIAETLLSYDDLGRIVDADIVFDRGSVNEFKSGVYSIQNTALHEMGHMLGLRHNENNPASIMCHPCSRDKGTVGEVDVLNIIKLYPY